MAYDIRAAVSTDLCDATTMLRKAGLPTEDLEPSQLAFCAMQGEQLVGLIGRELFAEIALLRSLVVDRRCRGQNIAERLIEALLTSLHDNGVAEVWLLTTDAAEYFKRHGFVATERMLAPDEIRATREFAYLCPDDAVVMRREL